MLVAKAQINYYIQVYSLNSEQLQTVKVPIIHVLSLYIMKRKSETAWWKYLLILLHIVET